MDLKQDINLQDALVKSNEVFESFKQEMGKVCALCT